MFDFFYAEILRVGGVLGGNNLEGQQRKGSEEEGLHGVGLGNDSRPHGTAATKV